MHLTLLLLAQVAAEWVEIGQQHNFKPLRPHNSPFTPPLAQPAVEKTTKANRVYINHSLPEYNWNRADTTGQQAGDVKRIQLESSTVHAVRSKPQQNRRPDSGIRKPEREQPQIVTKDDRNVVNKEKKGLKYVNTGNVKRIQLLGTDKTNLQPNINSNRPIEVFNLADIDNDTEEDIFTTLKFENTTKNSLIKKVISTPRSKTQNNRYTENNPFYIDKTEHRHTNTAATNKNIFADEIETDDTIHKVPDIVKKLTHSEKIMTVTENELKSVGSQNPARAPLVDKNYRGSNIGNVKRVHLSSTTKTLLNRSDVNSDNKMPPIETIIKKDTYEVETVAKNQHQSKTTQQQPEVKQEATSNKKVTVIKTEKNRYEHVPVKTMKVPNPDDVMVEEILNGNEETLTQPNVFKVPSVATVKRVLIKTSSERPVTQTIIDTHNPHRNRLPLPNPEILNNEQEIIDDKHLDRKHYMTSYTQQSSKVVPHVNTGQIKTVNNNAIDKTATSTEAGEHNFSKIEVLHKPIPDFILKKNTSKDFITKNDSVASTTVNDIDINQQTQYTEKPVRPKFDYRSTEPTPPHKYSTNDNPGSTKTPASDTKADTLENVVKFVKVVAETISRNTRRTFKGKVRYLEDLKDTIMGNIEESIESVFPEDGRAGAGARRVTRGARGHVEFPSSEGALMSISFLTFAVFLIKLVLQIIHTYKHKAMMMTPIVASVGRTAFRQYRSRDAN